MSIAVSGLSLGYGARRVVEDVTLAVAPGECVALVGANGSGKSTLLRGLARLHKAEAGAVSLDGVDIHSIAPREYARRVAFLPQTPDPVAVADLTVGELAWRGRYPHQGLLGRGTRADEQAVSRALADTGLVGFEDRRLGELSGGERQRAWIAMALAQQPRVLLLDEPTSSLDVYHQVELVHLLRRLNEHGMTVIAAIHDLVLASRFAGRILALRGGRLMFDGPPSEVMTAAGLERVFGVPMSVLADIVDGHPVPIPRHIATAPRA